MIVVYCLGCSNEVLTYQKDGDGKLKRCYLNRILAPNNFELLQHNSFIKNPEDVPKLYCPNCGELIAAPIRYNDGRLALHLRQGSFRKKRLMN